MVLLIVGVVVGFPRSLSPPPLFFCSPYNLFQTYGSDEEELKSKMPSTSNDQRGAILREGREGKKKRKYQILKF